jgi:hypothetical protein
VFKLAMTAIITLLVSLALPQGADAAKRAPAQARVRPHASARVVKGAKGVKPPKPSKASRAAEAPSRKLSKAPSRKLAKAKPGQPARARALARASAARALPAARELASPRGPASRQPGERILKVQGQTRNLSMMLVLKSEKDKIKFGEVRDNYRAEILKTNL